VTIFLANSEPSTHGTTRQAAKENFFDRIQHYISEGDTALHVGAAAKQTRLAIAPRSAMARSTSSVVGSAQCIGFKC
jgi:hypothetical protein